LAIGNFNGQFKGMFDLQRHVPTKGEPNTRRYLLDAVLVYQLNIWYGFEHGLILHIRLEIFLKAAQFTTNLHLSILIGHVFSKAAAICPIPSEIPLFSTRRLCRLS
jgi:hypothetical protein